MTDDTARAEPPFYRNPLTEPPRAEPEQTHARPSGLLREAAADVLTLCDCMALHGQPHDLQCISNLGVIKALRAALAADEPGLDVERLADAIHASGILRLCRGRAIKSNATAMMIHRATTDEPAARDLAARLREDVP